MGGKGLDIGTNMIVSGMSSEDGSLVFRKQRDAYYRIIPKTEVNKSSIKASLDKRGANYIIDTDGTFIVVGEDALHIAIERNDAAQRPMIKGVISPKEKASLPILKLIIETLVGKGTGENLFYSVPGRPVDSNFDITYHSEMMGMYIKQMGYKAQPINEAYAVALSELLDDGLTGVALSFGAGLVNVCIAHEGDPLVEFSISKSGDFIDQSVGTALDMSPSLVQLEKESGIDLLNPKNKIEEAISVYYSVVMNYTIETIAYEIRNRAKSIPSFRDPVPVVVSGGLTLTDGFTDKFSSALNGFEFPIPVGKVIRAIEPSIAVANGALLAANL